MTACPSDEELAGHLAGGLDAERGLAVAEHLDSCVGCRAVVVGAVRGGVVELAAVSDATATARDAFRARRRDTLAAGTPIGRYVIDDLLGVGGMGVVYVAHDTALDRKVALKVLRPDLAGDPSTLAERLVRESRLMAKASHPGVITVHDVGRDGDQVYVAMELIHGETLGKWLKRAPRAVGDVVEMFRRAGAGLGAAHRAGMVHRDFKPDNVLVELDGDQVRRVLVTDFGVARAVAAADDASSGRPPSRELDLTATGVAVGTPAYMAPEQLTGRDVDERADVFGFAVALWEALFGVRPFSGASVSLLRAAMNTPPTPPAERPLQAARGRVPSWIIRALLAALVADPRHRTPTIAALLAALDPVPRRRRRRRLVGALAGAVVAGGVALTVLAWPSPAAHDPCGPRLAELTARWSPARAAEVRAALAAHAADPVRVAQAIGDLDAHVASWRELHQDTCTAQPAPITACLDARLVELGAVGDELVAATAAAVQFPDQIAMLVGDPARCRADAPALREPRVPTDPALQRASAELRRQVFAIEELRIAGDFAAALAALPELEAKARDLGYDLVIAEVLYLRGSIETVGSDTRRGVETLRQAAATAQRAHYDSIAASVWIVLAHTTALDLHETEHALEYLDYAQPAVDRLGSPPDLAAEVLYTRGLIEADARRDDDAEAHMRQALAIAEDGAPELVAQVIQGLAFILEDRGRYADAAAQYARAIELHLKDHGPGLPEEVIYRGRYAFNLAHSGQVELAVAQARQALAVAEATLDEKQIDRMHAHVALAVVLRVAGRHAEALAEIDVALKLSEAILGARSQIYGETLETRAELLYELHRRREALATYDRACEILEFTTVDDSINDALCRLEQAEPMIKLGKARAALALIDEVLPIVETIAGDDHVQVASAQLVRADALLALRRLPEAAAIYEAARAAFADAQTEGGFEAAAEFGLAQAIAGSEPARATELATRAVERWSQAAPMWREDRELAVAWLARRRRPDRAPP